MKQINNNFIFFGAIHQDFVFELKNDLIKYRTNPIKHSESYGGVAHNVAIVISKNENVTNLYGIPLTGGIEIQVTEEDFERANELIKAEPQSNNQ